MKPLRRNKKSAVIDLKDDAAREVFHAFVRRCAQFSTQGSNAISGTHVAPHGACRQEIGN